MANRYLMNMSLLEKYQKAVDRFVKLESKNKSIQGIFVTGSFVTGKISPNSDVDIFLLHDKDYSQVKAKYINNIEFECAYKSYQQFLKDLEDKHPFDITRFAVAKILYDPQKKMTEIISKAKRIFKDGSNEKITDSDKYHLKDLMKDIDDDLQNPTVLISLVNAFNLLLKIFYKKKNLWGSKDKSLIEYLKGDDKRMAQLTENFMFSKNNKERFFFLKKIEKYVMNGVKPLPKLWKSKKLNIPKH